MCLSKLETGSVGEGGGGRQLTKKLQLRRQTELLQHCKISGSHPTFRKLQGTAGQLLAGPIVQWSYKFHRSRKNRKVGNRAAKAADCKRQQVKLNCMKRGPSKTVRSVRKRGEMKKEEKEKEKETNRQTETGQQNLLTKRCSLRRESAWPNQLESESV